MMGGPGRIVLRNQFNFDTALSWMTSRDPLASPIDTEKASLDFMREYSNLHAGILRASFERCGILFGVSLPQIMTGELKRSTTQLSGARSTLSEWILTDGKLHIVSTAEIDIVDSGKFEAARATLDSELLREQAKANSGTFDSTGFEFF